MQLKLAGDGELLLRGPTVMKSYRNDPARTAEAIGPGGWLHTGDLAAIDDDGYVTITGRKKDLIINAAGKNISPAGIESAVLAASLLIAQVVAVGDRRPYVVALIVLDPDAAAAFAARHGITSPAPAVLAGHPAVRAAVAAAVDTANAKAVPGGADQAVRHLAGVLGARRRRDHPDHETQTAGRHDRVRRRHRVPVRHGSTAGAARPAGVQISQVTGGCAGPAPSPAAD